MVDINYQIKSIYILINLKIMIYYQFEFSLSDPLKTKQILSHFVLNQINPLYGQNDTGGD
jgi:hypothetical protein